MKFSEIISHIKDKQYKQEFEELYNTLKKKQWIIINKFIIMPKAL